MKTKNHYIKWEGCVREYMTREEAIDTIRACAAVNVRQVSIGNSFELIGNLENDTYFSNVKALVARDGLTDEQKKLALKTLVPEIHAEANNLWDNSETEMTETSLDIRKTVSVWPEWRKAIGNRVRFVYCVQALDVDDATFETHSLRAALLDAALRLERRRVLQSFGE